MRNISCRSPKNYEQHFQTETPKNNEEKFGREKNLSAQKNQPGVFGPIELRKPNWDVFQSLSVNKFRRK